MNYSLDINILLKFNFYTQYLRPFTSFFQRYDEDGYPIDDEGFDDENDDDIIEDDLLEDLNESW